MLQTIKHKHYDDAEIASVGALLSVVAAAFVVLGVIIYLFGDETATASIEQHNPRPKTERMLRDRSSATDDFGLGIQFSRL